MMGVISGSVYSDSLSIVLPIVIDALALRIEYSKGGDWVSHRRNF